MRIVLLGPPGAGKGTVAKKAAEKFKIPHISTGDLFRNAIKNETELGKKVKTIIDSGELVSDELTFGLLKERTTQSDAAGGYILDGFPRTINQADLLAGYQQIDSSILLDLKDEVVIKRLSGRRICKKCGFIHHVQFMPPKEEGICDKCGGELYTRDDDKEESIRNRLIVYHKETAPLIAYYKEKGQLVSINAERKPDEVYDSVTAAMEEISR